MDDKLKILMLEDMPTDAELVGHALSKGEIDCEFRYVNNREGFTSALGEFRPNVALLDYKVPGFSGREALALIHATHPEIPAIMVTGTLGDEAAIELLKSGAANYVLKDNLARLAPAVREALEMEQRKRERAAAEQALRESETRFRALMENSSDITTVVAPDGTVLFDSPSIKRLLGYEPGELVRKNAFDLVHPDDVERTRRKLAELVRNPGMLLVMEHRLLTKDERWRVFESKGVYLPEAEGIHGVVINARDITDRIQSGLAVRRSERRFRRMFEAAKDGILLLHPANGDILDINPYLTQLLGYSRQEAVGKKFWEVFAFRCPEECEKIFVELRTRGHIRYDNLPLRTKDGDLVDVEFICNIYDENNHRAMQCNIRDLGGDKRMARLGLESELAGKMAEGLCLIRADDKSIVYTNPSFDLLFGYAEGELIGTNVAQLNVEETIFPEIEAAMSEDGKWEGDVLHHRKNGTRFWCHSSLSGFDHPEYGRVWLGVCMDITERREMERMKGELIATVTHELRTPLTTMLGFVDLMRNRDLSSNSRHEYLDMIAKEGARIKKLVNDFLDIQLIETGRQEFHFHVMDLKEKLGEIRDMYAKSDASHIFKLEVADDLPRVHADSARIHQVLENLLSNAVKFSPKDSYVVIGAQPSDSGVEVWVTDSGVGIDPGDLPKVFDKFYRVKHPMMQVEPGTGLGLSLVKNIVEAHGGRVWVESEMDHGSTFYFTLPGVK